MQGFSDPIISDRKSGVAFTDSAEEGEGSIVSFPGHIFASWRNVSELLLPEADKTVVEGRVYSIVLASAGAECCFKVTFMTAWKSVVDDIGAADIEGSPVFWNPRSG